MRRFSSAVGFAVLCAYLAGAGIVASAQSAGAYEPIPAPVPQSAKKKPAPPAPMVRTNMQNKAKKRAKSTPRPAAKK